MNRKILAVPAAAAIVALTLAGCNSHPSAQQAEQNAQTADTTSLEQSQPIPHYNYSQIRATAIDAETIAANGTQTTSFFFQMGSRDPVDSCPSLGEPVPNTAQLSNPEQIAPISGKYGGGATNLPQMDPDGIYAPSASEGTFVICVNGSGAKYLMYWEGPVMTVAAGATWDAGKHTINVTGAPTAEVHTATNK
jgi:uncharacterized lipoprotein NlpE involved in copper resistance